MCFFTKFMRAYKCSVSESVRGSYDTFVRCYPEKDVFAEFCDSKRHPNKLFRYRMAKRIYKKSRDK